MHPLAEKYLRKSALPTMFCPGCGNGIILNAMVRVADKIGADGFSYVSGIGCSSWLPVMIKADVLHTLHGRAVAAATGLKLAQPGRRVVVFTGDGDCLGIGGNHLIHAARRNIDLTVIMINNHIYGMTGGQASPTTPLKAVTKTTPYGSDEPPFDACTLTTAAGASFTARETSSHPRRLAKTLERAILHTGFSFLEVMTPCPVQAGRNIYGNGDPVFLFKEFAARAVNNPDESSVSGCFRTGILHCESGKPAYSDSKSKMS
ncbi:MAG: 2-oxoacid:ferredoxin oxidoreductase subunit beta [Desulfovibrio sp.]|jgi:2-oxoglutarate ferredoxin oxidoreductase subunit beta|nr:2-oxoacid:ferredoxin oxidoreductase subunit beta [Desulfovibrio sp.]